jgi:hypothetical protein
MIDKVDRYNYVDHLHHITQFRNWLDTNILFPTVPDTIVQPLREKLIEAESILLIKAYTNGDLDKVVTMQKVK